jgi:hypothetical protein
MRRIKLRNISQADLPLFFIRIKNNRPVRAAHVRPLPIQLGRIVRHGEKDPQKLSISNL